MVTTVFSINELREKRANLWQEAKTFLDTHRTENGTLSAEDGAAYDRMEAEIIDLGKEITRMENLQSIEAELNRPTAAPLRACFSFRLSSGIRATNAARPPG